MLNIKITISDDTGKKAEVEISEADNLTKLVIMQNVFNLFGADLDLVDMAKTYSEIGEAYSAFFNQLEPVEKNLPTLHKDATEIRQEMEQSYKDTDIKINNNEYEDDYLKTGIKISDNGTERYRLRYHCPNCQNYGTHYVYETSKTTFCHSCDHIMKIRQSTSTHLEKDDKGNFFYAGLDN